MSVWVWVLVCAFAWLRGWVGVRLCGCVLSASVCVCVGAFV